MEHIELLNDQAEDVITTYTICDIDEGCSLDIPCGCDTYVCVDLCGVCDYDVCGCDVNTCGYINY